MWIFSGIINSYTTLSYRNYDTIRDDTENKTNSGK